MRPPWKAWSAARCAVRVWSCRRWSTPLRSKHMMGGIEFPAAANWSRNVVPFGDSLRGYGVWALEERATGSFIGQAGLWFPEDWPEREIHWLLMNDATGKGFAPRPPGGSAITLAMTLAGRRL